MKHRTYYLGQESGHAIYTLYMRIEGDTMTKGGHLTDKISKRNFSPWQTQICKQRTIEQEINSAIRGGYELISMEEE